MEQLAKKLIAGVIRMHAVAETAREIRIVPDLEIPRLHYSINGSFRKSGHCGTSQILKLGLPFVFFKLRHYPRLDVLDKGAPV